MKLLKFLFFNSLLEMMVSQMVAFLPGRRIKAMTTDFIYILGASMPIMMIILIPAILLTETFIDDVFLSLRVSTSIGLIPFSVIIFVLINKDYFNARSIAKRKYGYRIVDLKSGEDANRMQCMLRNITCAIWPIEAIFILLTPQRRLGDRIAGTKIVDAKEIDPKTILNDIENYEKSDITKRVVTMSILVTLLLIGFGLLLTFI